MHRLLLLALLALGGAVVASAQSRLAIEESGCRCKEQDRSHLVFDRPEELARLVETADRPYLLLDVRSAAEYAHGHIPTAVNIPLAELIDKGLAVPKGMLVIVYCASGIRSGMATDYLQEQGYSRVVDFGSISRWPGELEVGSSETHDGRG